MCKKNPLEILCLPRLTVHVGIIECASHHVGHIIDAGTLPVGSVGVLGDELVFVGLHHASVQLLLQPVLGGAPPSATERQK